MKLSVYMITCNEEARLARTLAQAAKVADEIVVVDSGSTDETLKIAESFGAKTFYHEWKSYCDQKHYAESLCENIPENVCVLAYNKKFECARLKELAEKFPDLSKHLLNIKRNSDYGFFGKAACALYFSPSRRLSFPGISSSYRFFKQMKKLNKVLSNQPKSVFSSHFYGRFDITRLNS